MCIHKDAALLPDVRRRLDPSLTVDGNAFSAPQQACCWSCERTSTCSISDSIEHIFIGLILPHVTKGRDVPTFLEVGGFDGLTGSNTLFLESCLGWRGVLVEAQPQSFEKMRLQRPRVISIHSALCSGGKQHVMFTNVSSTASEVLGEGDKRALTTVPCGKLTEYLGVLGIHQLTFLSVDVQGSELQVVRSIDWSALNVSVVAIEERRVDFKKNTAVAAVLLEQAGLVRVLTLCNRLGRSCDSFFVNHRLVALDRLRSSISRFNFPAEHAAGLRSDDCGFTQQQNLFDMLVGFETEASRCMHGIAHLSRNESRTNRQWQCVEKTAANSGWRLGLQYVSFMTPASHTSPNH